MKPPLTGYASHGEVGPETCCNIADAFRHFRRERQSSFCINMEKSCYIQISLL